MSPTACIPVATHGVHSLYMMSSTVHMLSIIQLLQSLILHPQCAEVPISQQTSAADRISGTVVGDYSLSVGSSHGEPVPGSPFTVHVQPDAASAAHSSLDVLHAGDMVAGQAAQVQLVPRDIYGNEVTYMHECHCCLARMHRLCRC